MGCTVLRVTFSSHRQSGLGRFGVPTIFPALLWSLFRHRSLVLFFPFEKFDAPVYDQIHQEPVVAGMATQHRIENPSVQEQVIVQEILQVPMWSGHNNKLLTLPVW